MQETLHDYNTSIFISDRPVCSLRFIGDIDIMGISELKVLTNKHNEWIAAYGMELKDKEIQNNGE